MRYKILFFLSIFLLPFLVNAQDLFILDDSNTIIATKNPERTLGLTLDAKIEQNIIYKDVKSFDLKLPFFGAELQFQAEQIKVYADNFQIISLDMDGEDINNFKIDTSLPTVLIVGSEHNGVSKTIIENSDYTVSIPMKGEISSLNVSVATGITLYELCAKNIHNG